MPLQITLTDKQIRVSNEFIDFILNQNQSSIKSNWFDQLSENLNKRDLTPALTMQEMAGKPITDPLVKEAIGRSYNLTVSLLVGVTSLIEQIHQCYKFLVVVGCPRSGGSYLTKQLFLALGMDPSTIPRLLAHDGFPKAYPFSIKDGKNEHTTMTRYVSEFLTMVEMFYQDRPKHDGRIVVPKKDINVVYHGAFFSSILGNPTEYLVTIRHPVTCCISSYEKSGGYPEDGKFVARSNIEQFIKRDVQFTNKNITVSGSDYFDMYLRYWEQFYTSLAVTGLSGKADLKIVPYTSEGMMDAAECYYKKYKSEKQAEEFKVFNKKDRHPEWMEKAHQAICRVESIWERSGLVLPVDELMELW